MLLDIAALASSMKTYGLAQQISVAVTKLGMNVAEQTSDAIVQMMEQSVNPHLGGNLDIRL